MLKDKDAQATKNYFTWLAANLLQFGECAFLSIYTGILTLFRQAQPGSYLN